MALSYYKNWSDLAKAILGILMGFGSIAFGFVSYIILTHNSTPPKSGESPPMRIDMIIFGPLFGLLTLMAIFIYYYRFKTKDTSEIEKYFSFILLGTMAFTSILSYFLQLQF